MHASNAAETRRVLLGASALLGLFFVIVYLVTAFGFGGGTDLQAAPPNAFFDMDTGRVIDDWTSWKESGRPRTHPIYKYVAFLGIPLNHLLYRGADPVAAARIICLIGVMVSGILVGFLTWQLAHRRLLPALLAFVAYSASFSSILLASIPDTAALSCLFSVIPYLYLFARRHHHFTWPEALLWGLIALGSYGITISQLMHPVFALAFRAYWLRRRGVRILAGDSLRRAAAGAVLFVALLVLLTELQQELFKGTDKHYNIEYVIKREMKFFESEQLASNPVLRLFKLANHFFFYNFLAPDPVIAPWNPPRDQRVFISVTLVDEGLQSWRVEQLPLVISHFILMLLAFRSGRFREEHIPLALGIGAQFLMHFFYGREFIIYSPNWQALLVPLLFSAMPRPERLNLLLKVWISLHLALMLLNNVLTMRQSFELYERDYPKDYKVEEVGNVLRGRGGDVALQRLWT